MGGTSTSTTQQQSQTQPWAPAQPLLNGILGQLSGNLPNIGITGTQTNAINQIESNGAATGQFTPAINGVTSNLLAGGGALNQSPAIQAAYDQFKAQSNPIASNTNYNPYNTPGFSDAINTMTSDISNQVNGQYAAAGRDLSPSNSQYLARGISQGVAPVIASQYNQNVQNQQNAAGNLYNAGNSTSGLLSGLQQQYNQNRAAGISSVGAGLDAQNAGPMTALAAESQRLGIPLQNLGLLANIGIPIAGLGNQSTGTSNTQSQMSGAQQFATILGGIGSLGNLFKTSDRRAKEEIAQVGVLFDGTPVYRYRYKGTPAFEIGVMAQDIEKTMPEAVGQIGEYKSVNYKMVTDKALEAA